jgi:UDP-3-O-[3-hydroxymyristoyl] glucosamine N-acyltransferase
MPYSIKDIAEAMGAQAQGNLDLVIHAASEPANAGETDLALAMKPAFAAPLPQGKARAAVLWQGADWQSMGLEAAILAARPRLAMAGLTRTMDPGQAYPKGIHPTALIDDTAQIGADVSIGAYSIISAGARIGAGSIIGPQCFVGDQASLGDKALLHSGTRIMARVTIGARFIAQPGVIIGSDGFSFVTPEPSTVEHARSSLDGEVQGKAQSWTRIHSLGAVQIGDDVELGAHSAVDSGTIRPTMVGDRVKMDNYCHIGHNAKIGNDCLFAARCAIAGSSVIGKNVVFGGMVGVSDNISVGDNVVAAGGTIMLSKVPAGRVMMGYPAVKMDQHLSIYKFMRRLPRLGADVAALKKAVFKSETND